MNEDPQAHPAQDPASQPVAYDAQGRPLYAHPYQQQPSVVHIARTLSPEKPTITPEIHRLHERSNRLYPNLNLSEGEYVISAVHRHPVGLIVPLAVGTLVIGLILSVLFNYDLFVEAFSIQGALAESSTIAVPIWLFVGVVALSMFISYYVYVRNRFFLTNESVIQEIQTSLFSRQEQTVSLANIEDASFTQRGIAQQVLNYGDIRLSTEGDETTYRFSYVASPKEHIARLNNAIEAFKNGRPVDGN